MITKFLPGVLLGMCLPLLGGYLFLIMGGMPVTTTDAPLPFERYLAKQALKAAMRKEIGKRAPMPPDDTTLLAGAKVYRGQCVVCHGLPNQPLGAIAKGLFPPPPSLFSPDEGVTDDPEGKIYWKVKYGIRLTGMPGFQESLSETEIWQVSLLLLKANQLSEPVGSLSMPTPQALKHTVVNNRSHRWPGYPDYDTVSAQNRVAFPSREAAEQAGYRRARNCR